MASSQALAQSVFGNLVARGRLGCLAGLADEAGRPLFFEREGAVAGVFLDHDVAGLLGEPSPAAVDVWIAAPHRVIVDCMLAEAGIAECACSELEADDAKYCNRLFAADGHGCSLSEHRDADYWRGASRSCLAGDPATERSARWPRRSSSSATSSRRAFATRRSIASTVTLCWS